MSSLNAALRGFYLGRVRGSRRACSWSFSFIEAAVVPEENKLFGTGLLLLDLTG